VQAYLDHAATTPMRGEAVAAMLPYLTEHFGNPSGSHAVARRAWLAVDEARDEVARCLGCDPGEVVFTSGGTEADNLAVLGGHGTGRGMVLCSAIEHHAVRNACAAVGGAEVPVLRSGVIDLDALAEALHPGVGLVSVMLVNNEVGTVQPLSEVAALVRALAPEALLHTDAVAAVGWLDTASLVSVADLVSVSAHKFGGPKGVGALVVRDGARLAPVLHGGAQERDRRPGTHDVAGVVAMAAALRVATRDRAATATRVGGLRDRLTEGLSASIEGVGESTAPAGVGEVDRPVGVGTKVASSCHLCVAGVDQEELLVLLDDEGVCASAGAACASGAIEPSHVLLAMGLSPTQAKTAVRFSLGYTTTDDEVDHVLRVMPKVVERLRA
jgi:cysteine desulfurase